MVVVFWLACFGLSLSLLVWLFCLGLLVYFAMVFGLFWVCCVVVCFICCVVFVVCDLIRSSLALLHYVLWWVWLFCFVRFGFFYGLGVAVFVLFGFLCLVG